MENNPIIKVLASMPLILVISYFIPILGVGLIILRYFTYNSKKKRTTGITLITIGILVLIPKAILYILDMCKIDLQNIPYYNDVLSIYSGSYIRYSKFLIILGIVFYILYIIFKNVFQKTGDFVKSYIENEEQKKYEIHKKNNLKMQEKIEKSKNTSVVICTKCGASNMLESSTGICEYCRNPIQFKK